MTDYFAPDSCAFCGEIGRHAATCRNAAPLHAVDAPEAREKPTPWNVLDHIHSKEELFLFAKAWAIEWGWTPPSAPGMASVDAAEDVKPSGVTERTPKDFAIEHAEYLAQAAEAMLEADNELYEATDALENIEDDADLEIHQEAIDRVNQTRDLLADARQALTSGIYEFRKRRDRATPTPPEPVKEADVSGWRDVWLHGGPPCDGTAVFVGENEAGYMGCFNMVHNGYHGDCWMEGPEQNDLIMSGLRFWRALDRPTRDDAIRALRGGTP